MNQKQLRKLRKMLGYDIRETTQYFTPGFRVCTGLRGYYTAAKVLWKQFAHNEKHKFWEVLQERLEFIHEQ